MGTAKDEDHWTEMIDKAQALDNWYFSKATWRENPLIKEEWIEQERMEAELEHRLGPFLQETELIPFSQQGAVYPMFNKETVRSAHRGDRLHRPRLRFRRRPPHGRLFYPHYP
jgi:hypothetical protein